MERPVTTARDLLAGEWRHAWPAPLVRWLRERSFGLALDWVFRCTRELLPRTDTRDVAGLLADLDQLEHWRTDPPVSAVFRGKTEELWYRPGRDNAQNAMCTLCWHLACVVCPDIEVGPNWLWPVVSSLCETKWPKAEPRPELVEWCLTDFESFAAGVAELPAEQSAAADRPRE